MKIHADFECGNIRFLRQEEDVVYLTNEMRGTVRDKAYYWAFCVEGAAGKTLQFRLDNEWVGPYGAAVSHDLINWHWSESSLDGASFSYTFGEGEEAKVLTQGKDYVVEEIDGKFTRISFHNIPVKNAKKALKLTVALSDGSTAFDVVYSIADYVLQTKDGDQGDLMMALQKYVDSVSAYLGGDVAFDVGCILPEEDETDLIVVIFSK